MKLIIKYETGLKHVCTCPLLAGIVSLFWWHQILDSRWHTTNREYQVRC